jgi:hypothetical protein
MEDVSAYTVSSDGPGGEDLVHWLPQPQGVPRQTGRRFLRTSAPHPRSNSRSASQPSSPSLRAAVKKFKIVADYFFWTDVTKREARKMLLEAQPEDIYNLFVLDLPDVSFDIVTNQFYVSPSSPLFRPLSASPRR